MKGMILAAGLGTRFKPLTDYIPKPLIELSGKPIIDYSLDRLRSKGIRAVIINLHHRGEQIIEHLSGNPAFNDMHIEFSSENELLGTSGGVKRAEYFFSEDDFILLNSDMLFDIDIDRLTGFHNSNEADITLSLTSRGNQERYGTIGLDDDFRVVRYLDTSISEKERYTCIFKGIHIISPGVLKEIPENIFQDFSRHTYPYLLKKGFRIYGYISDEFWLPIGDLSQYLKVLKSLHSDMVPIDIPYPSVDKDIYISDKSQIDPTVRIYPPVIICDNVIVEAGCSIGPDVIIGNYCRVESNVTITDSVLYSKVFLNEGLTIKYKLCTPYLTLDI